MKLNKVHIIGNLVADPKGFGDGCNFILAVNGWKEGDVSYVDCEAWAKVAEVVMQYCRKGSEVLVIGRLKQGRWKDKEGHNRSRLKVVVSEVQLGRRPHAEDGKVNTEEERSWTGSKEEDIPF